MKFANAAFCVISISAALVGNAFAQPDASDRVHAVSLAIEAATGFSVVGDPTCSPDRRSCTVDLMNFDPQISVGALDAVTLVHLRGTRPDPDLIETVCGAMVQAMSPLGFDAARGVVQSAKLDGGDHVAGTHRLRVAQTRTVSRCEMRPAGSADSGG